MLDATPAERTVSLRAAAGDAGIVVTASVFASLLNVAFQFLATRLLGPEKYGTFAAALAIGATLLVLGSALSVVAMQETARMWAAGAGGDAGAFLRRTMAAAMLVATIVAALVFGASFALGSYLHIVDAWIWLGVAAFVGAGLIASYARGAAQGAHRFSAFGASVAGDAATRLVVGVGAIELGFGVAGAVFGLAAGIVVGAIIAAATVGAFGSRDERARTDEHLRIGGRALRIAAISLGGAGLMFVDLVFAKHYFPGALAGLYGAAGTIARMIPYGIGILAPVLMARAAAALHVSDEARGRVAALTFGSSAALALLALAVIIPLASPLVRILFGPAYAQAAHLLPLYAVEGAVLAMLTMGLSYLGAVGDFRVTPWLIACVAAEAGAMAAFGTTPQRLLWTAIVAGCVLMPIVGICVARAASAVPKAPGVGYGEGTLPA